MIFAFRLTVVSNIRNIIFAGKVCRIIGWRRTDGRFTPHVDGQLGGWRRRRRLSARRFLRRVAAGGRRSSPATTFFFGQLLLLFRRFLLILIRVHKTAKNHQIFGELRDTNTSERESRLMFCIRHKIKISFTQMASK